MTPAIALPHSTPEAQGVPSAAINAFVSAAEHSLNALHSFMLLRHGHVVAQGWWDPYRPTDPHVLFSLSKSFTSTAIGLLVAEGQLSIDAPVLAFFPDDTPPAPSANLKAMCVRHLLSMSTGHAVDTTMSMVSQSGRTWVQGFLAHPVDYTPGTHFLYNSGATYMLSAIVHKLSGGRMLDYLQPRLFEPLGIATPRWETSPQGVDIGGWGLTAPTADIAAFGQLYLQQGLWQGRRLLPQVWVEAATSSQVSSAPAFDVDWEQGYGYQFWRCRHDAYRGDGVFGQYCVVMPTQDDVLAITGGLRLGDMQPPLNLIWEHLLPAMGDTPLSADPAAQQALAHKLVSLKLPTPQGRPLTTTGAHISGQPFRLDDNQERLEVISFDFGADETLITLRNNQGEQRIACGYNQWLRSTARLDCSNPAFVATPRQSGPWKIGASGAWTDEHTYTAKLWWHETPFARTLTAYFSDDELIIEQRANVGLGPIETTYLTGRLAQQSH